MGSAHDPGITGTDIRAAAAVAGLPEAAQGRLAAAVAPGALFGDLEALAGVAGPAVLGVGVGRWSAVFAPLFGEFE